MIKHRKYSMLHLTKKWVRQNLVKEGMHPLFIKHEFGYSKDDIIAGMISCDDSFSVPFTTKDGRHWLMFCVKRINEKDWPKCWHKGYRYIMILYDADDFIVYRPFISLMATREWLYTYFNSTCNLTHIENYYHYL